MDLENSGVHGKKEDDYRDVMRADNKVRRLLVAPMGWENGATSHHHR